MATRTCADCPATIPAKGNRKRCVECQDKAYRARQSNTAEKRGFCIQREGGTYVRPPGFGASPAVNKKKAWRFKTEAEARKNCGPGETVVPR